MPLSIPSDPLTISVQILDYFHGFPITGTMIMFIVELFLFGILFYFVSKFRVHNPSRFQLGVEMVFQMVRGLINQIAGDDAIAKKILPLVSSLIILILVSDIILTFLPFLTGFTYKGIGVFRSHTNDFNTTFALATISVLASQIFSVVKLKPLNYFFKYIKIKQVFLAFRKSIADGMMSLIDAFIGFLDIISEFAKVISLSLRLFGNMFAGELLQGVLMGIFALMLPLPMIGLSLLSGVIQAIVFGSLVTSYLASALKENI